MIKALIFFCMGMLFTIGFMKLPNAEAYGAFVFLGLMLWYMLPDQIASWKRDIQRLRRKVDSQS